MAENLTEKLNELHYEFKSALDRADTVAVDRLNAAMSDVEKQIAEVKAAMKRPTLSNMTSEDEAEVKCFINAIRTGETKSLNTASGPAGAVTVPKVIESAIYEKLVDISPVRSIARVITVSTPNFTTIVSTGAASGWVGETAARPETTAPVMNEVVVPFGELYANVYATQVMLDDSQFDVEALINSTISTEFARGEGAAHVAGSGSGQPLGFLSTAKAATPDGARAFGTLEFVLSGAAGALPASVDKFIDLTHKLKAAFRKNAKWAMNRATLAEIRKYKDSTGQYLWQPSNVAGAPSTFLGYEIVEMEDMPVAGASNYPVAFGDFNAGYLVADRIGMTMLRDPYSSRPYISFYATKRVGGAVTDSDAIKLLKSNNA